MAFPTMPAFGAVAAASADLLTLVDGINYAVGAAAADRALAILGNSNPWVIPTNTYTPIGYDIEYVDRGGMFAGGTDVVIQEDGVYLACGFVEFESAAGNKDLRIFAEGVVIGNQNLYGLSVPQIAKLSVSGMFPAVAGDVVTFEPWQSSGGDITVVSGYRFAVAQLAL